MFLSSLNLQNFRSFKKKSLNFSSNTILIIGPNASGKTNVLEAIYLLGTGKSFRAQRESEMIKHGAEIANIQGRISTKDSLEIILTTGEIQGKRTAKKLYKINGVGKRWRDFVGNLRCVLFRPEDIEIILGSPSLRRNYLDLILEQIDWQYRVCNLAYQKGLRQRNKLLVRVREAEAQRSQLTFWNQLLIKNGELVTKKREKLIDFFNQQFKADEKNIRLIYDKSVISEKRLEKYKEVEISLGTTMVGPQRDDFIIQQLKRDISLYGSRGEQRMAVLALKLAELEFINQETQERPTLLLDDIFSELDREHRNQILKIISKQQTIITATEVDLVDKKLRPKMEFIKI